ncbi:hypothetical protein V0U79_10985 [Hyphobacterium sp. HN65]|uniref:Uncharacterized protein n=1 Tax=Hyphobacterium lacteum TaxID=3116575 RepID=A0ABU7LSL3_9PROT|nr:hypothetical protein [Hyphobacterium sp. HN65]MEE2526896.1 hypothetical protein [Hyphobacterium sp. HN65]
MKFIAAIASLLLIAASPPPPPPDAPEIAQGEFDGYDGAILWNAWRRATYDAAANGALEAYDSYNADQPGAMIGALGPRGRRGSPFYWTETFRFAYNEICQGDECQWRYHHVNVEGETTDFDAIAERLFDGAAAAGYLRANGLEPGQDIPADHRAFGRQAELDEAVAERIRLVSYLESECPDVAHWQQRYESQIPPPVATPAGEIPPHPLPPLPFNVAMQLDMPGWAVGSDELWVRREDSRDRILLNILGAMRPSC